MAVTKKQSVLYIIIGLIAVLIIGGIIAVNYTSNTHSPAKLLSLGEKYLSELSYEQAIVQFLKVIEIEPMNARAYIGAAEAYIELEKIDEAIAILEKGFAMLPDNIELRQLLDELTVKPKLNSDNPQDYSTAATDEEVHLPTEELERIELLLYRFGWSELDFEPEDEANNSMMFWTMWFIPAEHRVQSVTDGGDAFLVAEKILNDCMYNIYKRRITNPLDGWELINGYYSLPVMGIEEDHKVTIKTVHYLDNDTYKIEYTSTDMPPDYEDSYITSSKGYIAIIQKNESAAYGYYLLGQKIKTIEIEPFNEQVYIETAQRYVKWGVINDAVMLLERGLELMPDSTALKQMLESLPDASLLNNARLFVDADGGLRMREEPGTEYEIIKIIPNGSLISEIKNSKSNEDWIYVYYDGDYGWVNTEFIAR